MACPRAWLSVWSQIKQPVLKQKSNHLSHTHLAACLCVPVPALDRPCVDDSGMQLSSSKLEKLFSLSSDRKSGKGFLIWGPPGVGAPVVTGTSHHRGLNRLFPGGEHACSQRPLIPASAERVPFRWLQWAWSGGRMGPETPPSTSGCLRLGRVVCSLGTWVFLCFS